ncbi:hypothetical protein PCASD_16973 [Puccinia coronata f. sp. avenae]|uniref:Uncharacterized protein n=1 Tax=Puccinia coronata f. sp. avenae TaxID=200324 RepID=A0A2N5U2W2_9BASI|nr:hypothetical protein PCASD_16973 [Puccinia coronata f. sp. avenae]
MLAIQAGLPNHVEFPERSGRLQSPWRKVLGGRTASARLPTPANQKNTVWHTRTAGTAAANRNLIARPQAQQAAGPPTWVGVPPPRLEGEFLSLISPPLRAALLTPSRLSEAGTKESR